MCASEPGQMRQLREVIGQGADIEHILVVGPQAKTLPNQNTGVELVEKLLLIEQLLRHTAAERRLARVTGNAQIKAAQRLVLGWDQDQAVSGHERRRQAGLCFSQTTSEIFELLVCQLALGGLVFVDVAQ